MGTPVDILLWRGIIIVEQSIWRDCRFWSFYSLFGWVVLWCGMDCRQTTYIFTGYINISMGHRSTQLQQTITSETEVRGTTTMENQIDVQTAHTFNPRSIHPYVELARTNEEKATRSPPDLPHRQTISSYSTRTTKTNSRSINIRNVVGLSFHTINKSSTRRRRCRNRQIRRPGSTAEESYSLCSQVDKTTLLTQEAEKDFRPKCVYMGVRTGRA